MPYFTKISVKLTVNRLKPHAVFQLFCLAYFHRIIRSLRHLKAKWTQIPRTFMIRRLRWAEYLNWQLDFVFTTWKHRIKDWQAVPKLTENWPKTTTFLPDYPFMTAFSLCFNSMGYSLFIILLAYSLAFSSGKVTPDEQARWGKHERC